MIQIRNQSMFCNVTINHTKYILNCIYYYKHMPDKRDKKNYLLLFDEYEKKVFVKTLVHLYYDTQSSWKRKQM